MLRELELEPVYDSAEHNIVQDLMVPCLKASTRYLRGVGFFSSGWLRLAAQGLVGLVENGGHATFVVSPILDDSDWEALRLGTVARDNPVLHAALERGIEDLERSLLAETRNTLAWLVADGVLDFLIAIARQREHGSDYHDKVGLFVDDAGDRVAFHGSFNDSIKGSLNGEAFSVFRSWDPGQSVYVDKHESRLSDLVANHNAQFEVLEISDAARQSLIRLRTTPSRPYRLGTEADVRVVSSDVGAPACPYSLREYQKQAVSAWLSNDYRGLWEMATGTGKTITSLAAACAALGNKKRQALIVLVPYLHLLEQWEKEARTFGYDPVLCGSEHARWHASASSRVDDFNIGATSHVCLIAVHPTGASDAFLGLLQRIPSESLLVLADEVHALGATRLRAALCEHAGMRLGLSATPRRWYDDEGTQRLLCYFSGIVFEFGLEDAIGKYLTPYDYIPVLVGLTEPELEAYQELSARIALASKKAEKDEREQARVDRLLLERARIIWKAENKLPAAMNLLQEIKRRSNEHGEELSHVLVYCAPGEHSTVLRNVAGLGIRCHEFVHSVGLRQRRQVLEAFANGDIQALVAMKCLDEGVDVPSTRVALFMASTTNPREFVQRRGRVLRRAESKSSATIHDLITVPPGDGTWRETGRSLLRREMPRFAEFASAARNQYRARRVIRNLLDQFGMLHLLDVRPWEIYRDSMSSGDLDARTIKSTQSGPISGDEANGNSQ